MNILIFCGYLSKKLNANNKIACIIAKELAIYGHNVTLAGINTDPEATQNTITDSPCGNYKQIYITPNSYFYKERQKFSEYISAYKGLRLMAILTYAIGHPVSFAKVAYSYSPFFHPDSAESASDKFVAHYCNTNNIDCAIAVCNPTFTVPSVMAVTRTECKKVIWQLDPQGLHEMIDEKSKNSLIQKETEWFNQADHIFTTDVLLKEYAENSSYSKFMDKLTVLEFPTLEQADIIENCPVALMQKKINILFCGTIDDRYRSPKKTLQCLEQIWAKDDSIAIHFVGINHSSLCKEYAEKYPGNVFIHQPIETQFVPALLTSADILLNIGNTFRLQVPSKIFEYFATGKPIIHQQVIDCCTCAQYIDKYPLAFSLNDSVFETADKLHTFIKNSQGKSLNYNCIKQIYSGNTPKNVAQKMLDTMLDL